MMAKNGDVLAQMLSCVVCMEDYDEDGHIPRLLPCTHTLCENCVKQLIRNQRLECPECRAKHDEKNEEKSFPQNKYLLVQIRKKKTDTKEDQPVLDQCKKHGKELVLYCLEEVCQTPICVSCLKADHKRCEENSEKHGGQDGNNFQSEERCL